MKLSIDKIEKLIKKNKEDNFLNHLITFITMDYRMLGLRKNNQVLIWQQTIWLRAFYPIFIFEIDDESNLIIKDKLNTLGKILTILITLFIVLSFLPEHINDINFLKNWKSESIFYLLFTIGFFLFRYTYISEKEIQLCKILSRLNIESNAIIDENIWSIKDIIVRFICYPFSFFLLNFGIPLIFSINNNKSILTGVFCISLALVFLYADTKIILSNKKMKI